MKMESPDSSLNKTRLPTPSCSMNFGGITNLRDGLSPNDQPKLFKWLRTSCLQDSKTHQVSQFKVQEPLPSFRHVHAHFEITQNWQHAFKVRPQEREALTA